MGWQNYGQLENGPSLTKENGDRASLQWVLPKRLCACCTLFQYKYADNKDTTSFNKEWIHFVLKCSNLQNWMMFFLLPFLLTSVWIHSFLLCLYIIIHRLIENCLLFLAGGRLTFKRQDACLKNHSFVSSALRKIKNQNKGCAIFDLAHNFCFFVFFCFIEVTN